MTQDPLEQVMLQRSVNEPDRVAQTLSKAQGIGPAPQMEFDPNDPAIQLSMALSGGLRGPRINLLKEVPSQHLFRKGVKDTFEQLLDKAYRTFRPSSQKNIAQKVQNYYDMMVEEGMARPARTAEEIQRQVQVRPSAAPKPTGESKEFSAILETLAKVGSYNPTPDELINIRSIAMTPEKDAIYRMLRGFFSQSGQGHGRNDPRRRLYDVISSDNFRTELRKVLPLSGKTGGVGTASRAKVAFSGGK